MATRFYDPAPVIFTLDGLYPLAGGSLAFYQKGTTTPKGTWADEDLTVPNQNPVPLDSSGRANTNIWLDGGYTVRALDAFGASVWVRDVDDGGDSGLTIPTLQANKFLSNDGSQLAWADILQVPDPTGSDGKLLTASGGGYILTDPPGPPPTLPVQNFADRTKIGTLLIVWGSGSAPASGFRQSSASVTFSQPAGSPIFSGEPTFIGITPRNATHTAGGQIGVPAVTVKSDKGFSVQFDTDDAGQTNAQFIAPEPFDWIAYGPTTA